jgi:hypothetical protein
MNLIILLNLQIDDEDFVTLLHDGPVRPTVHTLNLILDEEDIFELLGPKQLVEKYPNLRNFTTRLNRKWWTSQKMKTILEVVGKNGRLEKLDLTLYGRMDDTIFLPGILGFKCKIAYNVVSDAEKILPCMSI